MALKVRMCQLFKKTFDGYSKNKLVKEKVADFIRTKAEKPMEPYGSKDRPFTREGNLSGYIHAGITFDVSIVYRLGTDGGTKTLDLYGVFSHDELGTGSPANKNRQKSNAEKLSHQTLT